MSPRTSFTFPVPRVQRPPILVEFERWEVLLLMVQRYGLDAAMMSPLAWLLYYNHNHGFANNVSILVAKPS